MEFTDAAWGYVLRLLTSASFSMRMKKTQNEHYRQRLDGVNLLTNQTNYYQSRIDANNAAIAEYKALVPEVLKLSASEQVYDVVIDDSRNTDNMLAGALDYNRQGNGNIEMKLPTNAPLLLFAHELKHAYQFDTGSISAGGLNPLYDKYDEIEAYNRGAAFGGESYIMSTLPAIYKDRPNGPVNVNNYRWTQININNPGGLQSVADKARSAFRVNGITYIPN